MTRVLATLFSLTALVFFAQTSVAYNAVKKCGSNNKCRIVDVLDRTLTNQTRFSSNRVQQAYDQLKSAGCSHVSDVVIGGTFGENGAPGSNVPAGFANHLMSRCVIVVHYELEGPVIDAQAYEDSTEHGRKALAIALNKVDRLHTAAGNKSRIRVWGHSKGAAIAQSTWRMEARNKNTKYITTINGKKYYVNACPSNNCYYFGFGYPYTMEKANRFSISRAAASNWSSNTKGYISKPAASHSNWWRLTTYTNSSDPIYTCNLSCAWNLVTNSNCHRYERFTRTKKYAYFDKWNQPTSGSSRPSNVKIGNYCGP